MPWPKKVENRCSNKLSSSSVPEQVGSDLVVQELVVSEPDAPDLVFPDLVVSELAVPEVVVPEVVVLELAIPSILGLFPDLDFAFV